MSDHPKEAIDAVAQGVRNEAVARALSNADHGYYGPEYFMDTGRVCLSTRSPPPGPHYHWKNCVGWKVDVTLNGSPIQEVIECDSKEGWAVVLRRDLYKPPMDHIPRQRLQGAVRVAIGDAQE